MAFRACHFQRTPFNPVNMASLQPWERPSAETGGNEVGILERSQGLMLGTKSAAWLKKNEDKAFNAADEALEQVIETQGLVTSLLEKAKAGILPQVPGNEGPEDMSELAFAERIVTLNLSVLAGLEKIVTIRNKVVSGGTNVLTAALIGSAQMQAASRRQSLAGNQKTARRVGVDAIPPGVIDV